MVRAWLSGWCARGAGERRAAAHPVELPGPLHVLEVLPADVVLDERALLAHHRGLALLLLRHRLGLRAPRAQALQLLLQGAVAVGRRRSRGRRRRRRGRKVERKAPLARESASSDERRHSPHAEKEHGDTNQEHATDNGGR